MKSWLKTGMTSAGTALLIVALAYIAHILQFIGLSITGIEIFYAVCFIFLAFFMGNVMSIILNERTNIEIDKNENSKPLVMFFNGLAFYIVLGFGFSIEIFQTTKSSGYSWLTIFIFFVVGAILMSVLAIMNKYSSWRG
jgi:hypothetical protein